MKTLKVGLLILLTALLLCAALAVYALWIEPSRLSVDVVKLGEGQNDVTVVQLSDIEISEDYSEKQLAAMVQKVNEQEADFIVFTGDLFSNYAKYGPLEAVQEALGQLEAKSEKLAIYGNNDYGGGAVRVYADSMERAGFTVLVNEGLSFVVGERSIWFGGLDDQQMGSPDWAVLSAQREEKSDYEILLTHEPVVPTEADLPDLILAGHTHGGQVKLPFLEERFSYDGYLSGMYPLDGGKSQLFVHHGMGTSRFPIRFGAPPQIVVFEIAFAS